MPMAWEAKREGLWSGESTGAKEELSLPMLCLALSVFLLGWGFLETSGLLSRLAESVRR